MARVTAGGGEVEAALLATVAQELGVEEAMAVVEDLVAARVRGAPALPSTPHTLTLRHSISARGEYGTHAPDTDHNSLFSYSFPEEEKSLTVFLCLLYSPLDHGQ